MYVNSDTILDDINIERRDVYIIDYRLPITETELKLHWKS